LRRASSGCTRLNELKALDLGGAIRVASSPQDGLPPPLRPPLLAGAPAEARAKGLPLARDLFRLVHSRLREAAATLGADLVSVAEVAEATTPRGLRQRGRGFAERLRNAFEDVGTLGYEQVVVVPGDVPGLGQAQLRQAFRHLEEEGGFVLGPSPDGGVYLIGCRVREGHVLGGVRWQTSDVLADLVERVPTATLLDPLADVDRRADLGRLAADVTLPPEVQVLIRALGRGPSAPRERVDFRPRDSFRRSPESPRGPPSFLFAL